MLRVGRSKNKYLGQKWHLIRRKFWGPASTNHISTLMVQYFCMDEPKDMTPTKYNGMDFAVFDKATHRKELCENCVKKVSRTNR